MHGEFLSVMIEDWRRCHHAAVTTTAMSSVAMTMMTSLIGWKHEPSVSLCIQQP